MEASGMTMILKICQQQTWGTQSPHIHFKQINPHIELYDGALLIHSEQITIRSRASYQNITSRGHGGSNVHMCFWNTVDDEKAPSPATAADKMQAFMFWPGGGGKIDGSFRPRKAYTIIGSWNEWERPEDMTDNGDGVYSYVMTLGQNCFE